MSVIEIVGGAILLVASLVIVFLTLMQHTHVQPVLIAFIRGKLVAQGFPDQFQPFFQRAVFVVI